MRTFSFFLSAFALVASVYFLVTDFLWTSDSNHLIYMGMLLTLVFICILGLIVTSPFKARRRMKNLIYNSYSNHRIRNKEFDRHFKFSDATTI